MKIEELKLSPITINQLQKILNYLVENKEYNVKFGDIEINFDGVNEIFGKNNEVFIIFREKKE